MFRPLVAYWDRVQDLQGRKLMLLEEMFRRTGRYLAWDEYTIADAKCRFANGTRHERLEFLGECYAGGPAPPYELARLMVCDADPLIRLWMARHARDLDYSSHVRVDGNLWEQLKRDDNPLVRASVFENKEGWPWISSVQELYDLPHMCRLACLRNPILGGCLIGKLVLPIFDTQSAAPNLTESERDELAVAFLTNPRRVASSRDRHECSGYDRAEIDGCLEERRRLWELICVYPRLRVVHYGFEFFATPEDWRAATYADTKDCVLRMSLLRGASKEDGKTIALGKEDETDVCRQLALMIEFRRTQGSE